MLVSFHGKQEVKDFYLKRINDHYEADEIVKGKYWGEGKGCAVGCTIHSGDHSKFETELGIPEWLARVEDTIFEGLPNEKAKEWPRQLLKAVNVGSNLSLVKNKFIYFILEQSQSYIDKEKFKDVFEVIENCKKLHQEVINGGEWTESAARSAARSAESAAESAWSAWSAARSAAESAESAARSAAWSAARSAARSAAESAAESAARSAARSAAESAAVWSAARSAARSAAYRGMASKILEILSEAK